MATNTDINEALLQDLLAIYTDAENQLLEKVAKRVKRGVTEEGWTEQKLEEATALRQEVEALLKDKNKVAKLKVGQGILKAYKSGVNSVEKDAGKPLTAMSELNIPLTIQNMLLTNYNLIDDASSKILRNVNDAYRDVMAEAATGLLSGVDTRVTASQKMMDKLAAKGITSFTDKAGRKWSMSTYTEMAMRTASAHAAIEGHIQTQQSLGMDLMKVSSIGTTCPICARWQGVVLSISGKTPGYLTVDAARADGLFHPNCKHTLIMYDPELDGPGKSEPNSEEYIAKSTKTYDLLQQQRANERAIRYWKRREAAAVDPKIKRAYKNRVNAAIAKNIAFCDKHGLVRMPKREGFKTGDPKKAYTVGVGQHLKEYTSLSDESVKALSDMGFSIPKRSPKVAVSGILEKPAAGDSKGMLVTGFTDTEAYKKMFGTKPADDFKLVGGEEGTGMKYGKWLATKVKATKTLPAVAPEDLKAEIRSTSLTEVYKKYIGDTPMPDFRAAGGEAGTGVTYAKWLKQRVDKIADPTASVMRYDSFESAPIKKVVDATKAASERVEKIREKAYDPIVTMLIDEAKKEVDTLTTMKGASKMMREATDEMKELKKKVTLTPSEEAKLTVVKEKLNMAKDKDIELLKEEIKGADKSKAEFESKWLKDFAKRDGLDEEVKKHALKKAKMWDDSISEIEKREAERKAAEEKRKREEAAKKAEEARKAAEKAKKLAAERLKKIQEAREATANGGTYPRTAHYLDGLDAFADNFKNSGSGSSWRSRVRIHSKDLGVSESEAQSLLDDALKGMIEDSEFGSRIRLVNLNKVLDSKFKNLFEVGTGGGCTNMSVRARGEEEVFGFTPSNYRKASFPIEDRPFYGMCLPKDDGVPGGEIREYYRAGPGAWYGDGTNVIYKKERIINNTTFTVGDSLNESGDLVASNANDPQFRGGRLNIVDDIAQGKKPELLRHFSGSSGRYLEIQIHGDDNHGVDIIDRVIFTHDYSGYGRDQYAEVKAKLDAMGIPWENWATGEKSSK